MDGGRAVQWGAPSDLLKDTEGVFARLIRETGPQTAALLTREAEAASLSRRAHGINDTSASNGGRINDTSASSGGSINDTSASNGGSINDNASN